MEWNGTVVLTTPRLLLRTFRRDDLPLDAALNADPEVARYLGGPLSRQDSDDIAEWAQECYAREALGLPRVIATTDPPNLRSLAVMRRLGMVFDHQAEVEDNGMVFDAVVCSITAELWRTPT